MKKASKQTTFMTSVGLEAKQSKKQPKVQEQEHRPASPEKPLSLSDPYEDDDFSIHFDKGSLAAFMALIEDDNLFKIHLVDEEALKLK